MTGSILAPGTRVGPYEVIALIGQGGMGQVYKAKDLRLSREVAFKIIRSDGPTDAASLARFGDEAKAASLLNHPNIVAVYDIGERDGAPYIISELLTGETLRDRLASGPIPVRKAVQYGVQILQGLAAAHDKGIVHRDLKPENLFLTKDGLVKILDFGIAKLGRRDERADSDEPTRSQTTPGTLVGTVGYMSPEQVRGFPADQRSDLFAFGAVFYEMLTQKRAFKGTTPADTLTAILREDPTESIGSGPLVAGGLLRVVRRALEKSPEDRFQTARDLAFALEGATTGSQSTVRELAPPEEGSTSGRGKAVLAGSAVLAVAALAVAAGSIVALRRSPAPVSYQRLTFRPGQVDAARFERDAETILYSARWGSRPLELFTTRPASARGERSLSLTNALIQAVSVREEMALLLRPQPVTWGVFEGTLARAPLAGGTPRETLEGVVSADWSPDGKDLAVIHAVGDRYQLEYPIGHVLVAPDPPAWMSALRVSSKGDAVAYVENPVARDMRGGVAVVDRQGHKRTLASGFAAMSNLAWAPDGTEIWFGASRVNGSPDQIRAVNLSGRQRLVQETTGGFRLFDVSPAGEALGDRVTEWTETRARARGNADEVDLAAADLSFISDISDDGKQVLGTDTGQAGGPNSSIYVQSTDGSPALWLGDGDGQALSPDGRSVLALLEHTQPQELVVVPTGPGETRVLEPGDVVQYSRAVWASGGRRVVFAGADKSGAARLYLQNVSGGPPTPFTKEGVTLGKIGRPVSPDDRVVVATGPDYVPALYPLSGGKPTPVPGLDDADVALCWTPGGRELMVAHYEDEGLPPKIRRVDVATGRSQPWTRIGRSAPSGIAGEYRVLVTPDGESYAYNYTRSLSDLYITSKLR